MLCRKLKTNLAPTKLVEKAKICQTHRSESSLQRCQSGLSLVMRRLNSHRVGKNRTQILHVEVETQIRRLPTEIMRT